MIDINRFIAKHVTMREESMFLQDIKNNIVELAKEIDGKRFLVIGGAGSIGSQFIKSVLHFHPSQLTVIDLSENGLAELTRDLRSSVDVHIPKEYRTYTLDFANPIVERMFESNNGYDVVANFSAHKHVRSEKDKYSVQALIENNDIKAKTLLDLLLKYKPEHFFCVSTDKAANPVNVMGASKLVMEKLIMSYKNEFPVTTARFANVAFSNGSLPDSWITRIMKHQPLVAPTDVKRYFVSPEESGQICMLACMLGHSGEIFFPKLQESQMKTFSEICDSFIDELGLVKREFDSDDAAKEFALNTNWENKEYPVVYTQSDTTGEKSFEEFYVDGEDVDFTRYKSLGVVKSTNIDDCTLADVKYFFEKLNMIFSSPDFTKVQVVDALKEFLPNFEHEEKGKNLDQKM